MVRFGVILLGLLLISVNSASAKMHFLPDYQNGLFSERVNDYRDKSGTLPSTPSPRSCSDYSGFISADKKGNMTCSVIKYFPQIGNCYSDCKCDAAIYKYTSANCSSLSGDICTDLSGNTYYSGCDDKCNGITGKDCGSFRCKKYYSDCSSECETCYTDTCDYPENSSYPLESSCDYGCDTRGHIEGCDKRCYACGTCQANNCSEYTLTTCPDNATCDNCIKGCGDTTVYYKFTQCNVSFYDRDNFICNGQLCTWFLP